MSVVRLVFFPVTVRARCVDGFAHPGAFLHVIGAIQPRASYTAIPNPILSVYLVQHAVFVSVVDNRQVAAKSRTKSEGCVPAHAGFMQVVGGVTERHWGAEITGTGISGVKQHKNVKFEIISEQQLLRNVSLKLGDHCLEERIF